MRITRLIVAASVSAAAAAAAQAPPNLRSQVIRPTLGRTSHGPFDQRILDAHNAERTAVGAPLLQWDDTLAAHAQAYAEYLAQTQKLVHAPREARGIERENLQVALTTWSPERMVQDWVGEKRLFHPGMFPNVCSGDWSLCAHYTQVIWPSTSSLGCGFADGGGFRWFVCRYSPGGNKEGKPVGIVPYRSAAGVG